MVMVEKEQHLKMRMEHIRFGKEELERRRKSPVHIPAQHVAAQLKDHYHVYIVDPRLGFNQRTFRFWINYRALGEEMEYSGKQLGHRHTVEAVIDRIKVTATALSTASNTLGRPAILSACRCSLGICTTTRAKKI